MMATPEEEHTPVPDDVTPAPDAAELRSQIDRSRDSAAHLLEALAEKLGASRAARGAAKGVRRAAHYVQDHPVKEIAAGIGRAARERPATAIAIAMVAGFLIGRSLRRR